MRNETFAYLPQKKKHDSLHFCSKNMKCSGNTGFLHNTYFTYQRARLLLYF